MKFFPNQGLKVPDGTGTCLLKVQQLLSRCILKEKRTANKQGACNMNIMMFCHLKLPQSIEGFSGELCWSCRD